MLSETVFGCAARMVSPISVTPGPSGTNWVRATETPLCRA
jgi:hypothetical protein